MKDGKVVGVTFQAYDEAQNIGYIIPTSVIEQFLMDLSLHNRYTGFVTLGISYQLLENKSLKSFFGLNDLKESDLPEGVTSSGILVCQCDTTNADSNNYNLYEQEVDRVDNENLNTFLKYDIILAINGHNIADDGTIHFRDSERVHLAHSLAGKFYGQVCEVIVVRNKRVMTLKV